MSRNYLLATWDGAGSLPPELAVVRQLTARGHRVTVLGDPTIRAEAAAAGAEFRPWVGAPHLKSRDPKDDFIRDFEVKGPPRQVARLTERLIATPAAVQARETVAAARDLDPDVVISSGLLLGPQIAAEGLGLPLVALFGNIYPFPAPGMPPFGTGWQPARGALGRARDAAVNRIGLSLWRKGLPAVNAARSEQGLPSLHAIWDQLAAAEAILLLTSEQFDFPGRLPANVVYAGPRLDDPGWATDWAPPPGEEPLVLASLSSGPMEQLDVLRRIATALGTLPVRGLITTGHGVDPAAVRAPANVSVVRSAPHTAVLGRAAAVIDHGGHGTVVKTLAAGAPQLVLPMGRDQLDNAARVVARGAGLRLKPNASPAAIAAAVRRLLAEPGFRTAAERLGAALRMDAQSDVAVCALEAAGTRTPDGDPTMTR